MPPNANCRSDAHTTGFFVKRDATPPATISPTPPRIKPAHSDLKPSRYGTSGVMAPIANVMKVQRAALVAVDLVGGLGCRLLRHSHRDQHVDEFSPLGLWMHAERAP